MDVSELESNLDSEVRSSRYNRGELAAYVHRPVFEHVEYPLPSYKWNEVSTNGPSRNVVALQAVVERMDINDDPYIKSLRAQYSKLPPGDQQKRIDQKLSKALNKQDTFSHTGMKRFAQTACDICYDLGPWAADWFVATVIQMATSSSGIYNNIMASWQEKEKRYLMSLLQQVPLVPVPTDPLDMLDGLSPRVQKLVEILMREEELSRAENEPYSGIVFVTRRDSVLVLGEILSRLSSTSGLFRVGRLLGTSSSFRRHAFLDITRAMLKETATDTLEDFRAGEKNLIISTAVAEEGIDIQACGSVIRFDPPENMVAWAQSRGRARRKKSRFIIMFDDVNRRSAVAQWEDMERQMMTLYTSNDGRLSKEEEEEEDSPTTFKVESTGYGYSTFV